MTRKRSAIHRLGMTKHSSIRIASFILSHSPSPLHVLQYFTQYQLAFNGTLMGDNWKAHFGGT